VIALHRHGHKWGRLPPLFWFSIAALIVTFHLFLVKLVVNEYCSGDVRARYRYASRSLYTLHPDDSPYFKKSVKKGAR
jgi:hypothetical protein